MRANSATTGNQDLFTVHISTYDADLEHILIDHGHHDSDPERAHTRTIFSS
jgi:hypothetical protein